MYVILHDLNETSFTTVLRHVHSHKIKCSITPRCLGFPVGCSFTSSVHGCCQKSKRKGKVDRTGQAAGTLNLLHFCNPCNLIFGPRAEWHNDYVRRSQQTGVIFSQANVKLMYMIIYSLHKYYVFVSKRQRTWPSIKLKTTNILLNTTIVTFCREN